MVPFWQKKSVWQVTTIIQPALCHLVTSHFQEIACNWTHKDQLRLPIFLTLLCMIVLTEKTSKFPQPIIFRILVFSCHKMTLITKITWMPRYWKQNWDWQKNTKYSQNNLKTVWYAVFARKDTLSWPTWQLLCKVIFSSFLKQYLIFFTLWAMLFLSSHYFYSRLV